MSDIREGGCTVRSKAPLGNGNMETPPVDRQTKTDTHD